MRVLHRDIFQRARVDHAVWNHHSAVFKRPDHRMPQGNFLDRTGNAADADEIPDRNRTVQHNEKPADEVRHGLLCRKTDNQRRHTGARQQADRNILQRNNLL